MQLTPWFQQVLQYYQPNALTDKNLKGRAKELIAKKGPCHVASMSSSARPFFQLDTEQDCSNDLSRSLLLTSVIGSLHKDASQAKLEILARMLQGDFEWEELENRAKEVLDLVTGYNCEELQDYDKRPMGFINSPTFIRNFSPWTLKLRDSRANAQNELSLPAYPGARESRETPPVGICTSCYNYYAKHHVRNNLGLDVNHFLNLQIRIDNYTCPLQALLSLQIHPGWSKQATSAYPELQALSDTLIKQIQSNHVFGDLEQIDPDKGSRLLIDELPESEEEIELTPVTSVQLLEDFQSTYRYITNDYRVMSRARELHLTMTVGDGNPVNIGAFASNRNGNIVHIGQSDNVRIAPGIMNRINRLYRDRVLKREETARHAKTRHPRESDYNFKLRKHRGFEYAVKKYLDFCGKLKNQIRDLIDGEEYTDKQDFLSFFNNTPGKQTMLSLLLEDFKNPDLVEILTNSIFRNLYAKSDIPVEEKQEDLQGISSIIWRRLT